MTPKKILSFAIGPLGVAVLGFVTLPLLTWYFDQETIGRITMLQIAIGFSTLLFSFGLDQGYVREFHEVKDKVALFRVAFYPGLLFLLSTMFLLQFSGRSLSGILFEVDSKWLSFLVLVALICAFSVRFLSLILRMNERGLAFSISQLMPKLLLLIIVLAVIFLQVEKSLSVLITANVMAAFLVALFLAWNMRREWFVTQKQKFNTAQLKQMLTYGFPLVWGGLAFWGLAATDKLMLREFAGYKELGLYSVSVNFASAVIIVQSVFSTVWAPIVYRWSAEGQGLEKVEQVIRYVLFVVVVLFCLAGLLSWLVPYILPESYESVKWIVISCLGYPLLYTLSETTVVGVNLSRRTSFALVATLVAFLVNLVGSYLIIPKYGAAGAAVSTCFSFWVLLVLRTEFSIFLWAPMPRRIIYPFSLLVTFGASFSTLYGSKFAIYTYLFWLVLLACAFIFFKKELFWFIAKMKNIKLLS